jgi:prolycopene isomerase
VIVIGSGIGGLVTASQLAAKGAKTPVLTRTLANAEQNSVTVPDP